MAVDNRFITIVGCGPGSPEYVTPAAAGAVFSADLLVGAQRLLDLFPTTSAERIVVTGKIGNSLKELKAKRGFRSIAVLVTGDPGLFSLAKLVIKHFGRDRCRVIPGVSSVQVAFAQIGLDWADARIVSAHKQDPEPDPSLKAAEKVAVLGGRNESLAWIANHLLTDSGQGRRIFVMENLTLEDQRVQEITRQDLATFAAAPRTVVLIVEKSLLD
jgi:cobalt-precorrin-7 (C5)-methyltransferase